MYKKSSTRCRAHSKRHGGQCSKPGFVTRIESDLCYWHGGAPGSGGNPPGLQNGGGGNPPGMENGGGRPRTHGLYSIMLEDEGERIRYDYYKSDPDPTSLRPEIAIQQLAVDRFIKDRGGKVERMKPEDRQLYTHGVDLIRKLKEAEARRLHNERVVNELVCQRTAEIGQTLASVLSERMDSEQAASVVAELANRLSQVLKTTVEIKALSDDTTAS